MGNKKKDVVESSFFEELPMKKLTEETMIYNLNEEDLPVFPDGTIPYELNLMELPIFSKNKKVPDAKIMRYVFDEKDEEYLRVIPSADPLSFSNKILQEFDEKIYYALLKIYRRTRNRRIVTDIPSLLRISQLKYVTWNVNRLKDSLQRLKQCELIFNKCYYDPIAKANGSDFLKRTKHINLISSLETITFEKFQEIKDGPEKENIRKQFERHGQIQEIIVVILNEDLVKNIESKSFKYFQQEDLLSLNNAVARKLYIMLTKWRFWEKRSILTRRVKFLASRIPLSWKPSGIPSTVKSLLHACAELKESEKIADYIFHKEQGLKNSTIDFCFTKNCLDPLNAVCGIETTGHEMIEISDTKEEVIVLPERPKSVQKESPLKNSGLTSSDIDVLVPLVREEYRKKKTMREIIVKALDKYDSEYVRRNILYTNKNAKGNYRAYLVKSLEADWGQGLWEDTAEKEKNLNLISEIKNAKVRIGEEIFETNKDGFIFGEKGATPSGEIIKMIKNGKAKIVPENTPEKIHS